MLEDDIKQAKSFFFEVFEVGLKYEEVIDKCLLHNSTPVSILSSEEDDFVRG